MSSSHAQQALLAHIAGQTKANLDFLVAQNYLTSSDVYMLRPKLTTLEDHDGVQSLSQQTQRMSMSNVRRSPSPAPRSVPPPPPRGVQARALWAYNADRREPNDLSFNAGDIIEIVNETNPDWYEGRVNGRTGLFPSNYVEKLASRGPSPPPAAVRPPSFVPPPSFQGGSQYPAPYTPPNIPPPTNYSQQWSPGPPGYQTPPVKRDGYFAPSPNPPYQAPPAPPPQDQGQKKSKFGGLGGTLANAAASGLGFGAGAAIGGDIVNSIF